jgi:hypothetical protein
MEWTREYHGITHLKIDRPTYYQITMNTIGKNGKCTVYLLNLNREVNDNVFTPVKEHFGNEEECKAMGEKWWKQLNGDI